MDWPRVLIGSVALTFFSAIALACAAGVVAGLVGLFGSGPETSGAVVRIVDSVASAEVADAAGGPAEDLVRREELAFALGVLALLTAAAAGAAYARVFRWTLAVDPAPFLRGGARWMAALGAMLAATGLGCAVAAAALIGGPLARGVAEAAGFSHLTVELWGIFKWPVAAGAYLLLLCALSAHVRSDRAEEPAWRALARWGGLLVWVLALASFGYYVAAFGAFSDNYGTGWAAGLSLLWAGLFVMLHLAMPLQPAGSVRPLAVGSIAALTLWLPASLLMALLVSHAESLSGPLAAMAFLAVTPSWLWVCTVGLLAGTIVRRRLELGALDPAARPAHRDSATALPGLELQPGVTDVVAAALANDTAQEGVLSVMPPAPGTPPGGLLTELERDVADWGYTYGVAWATARARFPDEPDAAIAARALAVARQVFGDYMGDAEWAERIQRERARGRAGAEQRGEPRETASKDDQPEGAALAPALESARPGNGANGSSAGLNEMLPGWRRPRREGP